MHKKAPNRNKDDNSKYNSKQRNLQSMKRSTKKKTSYSLNKVISIFAFGFILGFGAQYLPLNDRPNVFVRTIATTTAPQMGGYCIQNPVAHQEIHREGFSLAYDSRMKNPYWVMEHLTPQSVKGEEKREHHVFKIDPEIPEYQQAHPKDYSHSGFDLGHLVPAADQRSNYTCMENTFFISNISPQVPEFNRGYWKKLEKHVRDLTKIYPDVYVISGPLYLPTQEKSGKRVLRVELIGQSEVAVPTHFFKVIYAKKNNTLDFSAYVLPNHGIASDTPLSQFKTTIEKVQKLSGLVFFQESK